MLHKQRITWLSLLGLAYRPLRQFAGFVGISYALGSSAALADSKPQAFQKGETVCMVGDSITHGGMYHSNLYLFYATRFPTREVRLVNCGISGIRLRARLVGSTGMYWSTDRRLRPCFSA